MTMHSIPGLAFKPIDLDRDYSTLETWWRRHNSEPAPKFLLPRGWFAELSGVRVAASFLYLDPAAKIGVIEWTTSNPSVCLSKDLLVGVKALYAYLEHIAREEGAAAVISFVKPNSSEERILSRSGWSTSVPAKDPGHKLYAKALVGAVIENREGVISPCPLSQS